MDLELFKKQYTRLRVEFGAENFGNEKAKLMWDMYKSPELPDADAVKLFDWAIGHYQKKFPPTATQLINDAKMIISKLRSQKEKLNKPPESRFEYNTDGLSQALKALGHSNVQDLVAHGFRPKKKGSA